MHGMLFPKLLFIIIPYRLLYEIIELTLLEIQKLCFFLQEFGEPLKLRYTKYFYGTYADNIRHVLIDSEGKYTLGFGDGTRNQPDTIIQILPQAIEEPDKFTENNKTEIKQSIERLDLVESLIEGFETPFGMELLSTVYWIVRHDHVELTDEEQIVKAVHTRNPRAPLLFVGRCNVWCIAC